MLSSLAFALVFGTLPADSTVSAEVCSVERPAYASAKDAELAYRDLGPVNGRPVLLIAGTDQQMTQWPASFLAAMQAQGLRPIIYDSRDVGCSTHHTARGPVNWGEVFAALATGRPPNLAYDLETLAADPVAILDQLGITRADLVGVSGGATVAGELAAAQPERVGQLVLVMANSGNPALPMPADPARLAALPPLPAMDAPVETIAAYRAAAWRIMDGPDTLEPSASYPQMAQEATARSWDVDSIGRAGAALLAAGDRRSRFAVIRSPAVVIHGAADPLVSPAAGQEVATAIPQATFVLVPRMGHSLTLPAIEAILQGLSVTTSQGRPN
ncbi:hypothetical protein DA69_09110 [Brevundimonas naejangsanensis]|uniref:AB hydrolase-1 domain-containing protein n=1 Tax=Brevundimonas naejangsanensis TaxID=588932 RepID=A0A172Y6N8_9CAUL|nr:alpha/beta hydrolase [Brevundimonas naejangsanensis]ANF54889.1 hypothetical protein DA69_09110 [Brevundimonas naejangsanensis]